MPRKPNTHRAERRPEHRRSASDRGYDRDWAALRAAHLRAAPFCAWCESRGVLEFGRLIVDHVLPVHVRPDLRLDPLNLQTLCRGCHRTKTDRDIARWGAARGTP